MKQKFAGFTLVEVVVSITIGGVILATVMGTYLSLAKIKADLDISRKIQREMNFAMMRMGDRIRFNEISFDKYDRHVLCAGGLDSEKCKYGTKFQFKKSDNEENKTGKLLMNNDPLFSPQLNVEAFRFTVQGENDEQHRVQIEMLVSAVAKPSIKIPLRTTISSRLIQ